MTLIRRITRLFKADLHGILDCLEEPEAVLKQAVRDMQAEIEKAEVQMKENERRENEFARQRKDKETAVKEASEHVQLCIKAGDEKLAKSSVRRKLEAERRIKQLEREVTQLLANKGSLQQKLEEQRKQLNSVKERMQAALEVSRERRRSEEKRCVSVPFVEGAVSDDDVELAFLQEKQKCEAATSETA